MYTDQNRNKDKFLGFSKDHTRYLFKQVFSTWGSIPDKVYSDLGFHYRAVDVLPRRIWWRQRLELMKKTNYNLRFAHDGVICDAGRQYAVLSGFALAHLHGTLVIAADYEQQHSVRVRSRKGVGRGRE